MSRRGSSDPAADRDEDEDGDDLALDLSAAPDAAADSLEAMLHEAVAAPPTYPALDPGTVVAEHYVIERVLGAGGMGTVYLARDTRLDRDVALKLHRTSRGAGRLHREAIAMARLAHPNVVTVFEVGELDGRPFVAMEYVRGATLRAYLGERARASARTARELLAVLLAVGEGLAAAHDAGLVHRDVKPDNIFVGADGRARIGDFGLAQVSLALPRPRPGPRADGAPVSTGPEAREATGTLAGEIVGTPAYMAPEQIEGRDLDARTDQFAFCVVAWEALSGERPFQGGTIEALHDAITRGALRPGKRRVPARLRRVLARGMAVDPRDRWPSLRAVLVQLRAAQRRPRVIAVGAGAAVTAAAAVTWLAWPRADPAAACQAAGREIDELLPASLIDAAAGAVRAAGRPDADDEIGRITRAAEQHRGTYRELARQICRERARGQWTAQLAAAGRECLGYVARTSRELFVAAPGATSQTSNLVQIVTELPALAPCAEPTLLAGWRPLATDPARLDQIVAARARLDAAAILADLRQLREARAIQGELAASPVRTEPAVALRLDHLRGAIALHENRLAEAEALLAEVYLGARGQGDGALVIRAARSLIELAGTRRDAAAAQRWIRDGLAEAERHRALLPGPVFDLQLTAATALAAVGDAPGGLQQAERAELLAQGDELRLAQLAAVRARLHDKLGRTPEALAELAGALETHRSLLGARHPRVAELAIQYASILSNAEKELEARAAALEAQEILERAGGEDTAAVARAEQSLGVALLEAKDPAAAVHLERARKIWVASVGAEHPDVALVDLNLALVHSDRGEHDQAAVLLRRAIAVQTKMLGPDHDEIAASLYNLAVAERQAGKLEDALASARRCAEIYARRQPGSRRHGLALTHVALIQNVRGSFAEALAAATEVLAMPQTETRESQTGAWARLEAARALLGLRREPARARALLGEARARYAELQNQARLEEIDRLLAELR
ncbi:MAG TPA: serine/threonine-protein kinase [Kofleriaceae bacterium]|nr:serine/threonine-protein kinase [Kofleriaceae bacterium]